MVEGERIEGWNVRRTYEEVRKEESVWVKV